MPSKLGHNNQKTEGTLVLWTANGVQPVSWLFSSMHPPEVEYKWHRAAPKYLQCLSQAFSDCDLVSGQVENARRDGDIT